MTLVEKENVHIFRFPLRPNNFTMYVDGKEICIYFPCSVQGIVNLPFEIQV